jgi:hypothetical protein
MSFDHERLDVYQRALELLDQCDSILEQLPSGRAHLKDQLDRAATSARELLGRIVSMLVRLTKD